MFKKIEYPRFVYGIRIPAPTLVKYSAGAPFFFPAASSLFSDSSI